MRILVVEDDRQVARQIEATLRRAGYVIDVSHDGEDGHFLGETEPYDAVILDLGLPILTARDTWREKVSGLRAGADDYLAKPVELEEMLARLEALIRRASGHASPVLECGPVKLDTNTSRVTLSGATVELTSLEYRTLFYLMHHSARVISKTELTEHIYGQDFDRDSNVIEVLINRLRKKLGARLIKTRRGQGYQLAPPDDVA